MINGREFFHKLFIAGVMATVPYSILSISTGGEIIEKNKKKKINFSKYKAFLIYNDHIVAYSKHAEIIVQTPRIDITTVDSPEEETIPGPKEIYIKMNDAIPEKQYFVFRELCQSSKTMQFLAKDELGWKYSGDVYISNVWYKGIYEEGNTLNLDLYGVGPLLIEVPQGNKVKQ